MKNPTYLNARNAVTSLNRLVKRRVRLRRNEEPLHFEKDHELAQALYNNPHIVGFGVGPKVVAGKQIASEMCLVFFVRKKLPRSRLRSSAQIPERLALSLQAASVSTDIQEWGALPVAHGLVRAGGNIGDSQGNSGTVTLGVQDSSTGLPLILGCSHVLAECGNASVGDPVESPVNGNSVLGPNVVGRLLRFTRIDPGSQSNAVDAAVAQPTSGTTLTNDIPGMGRLSELWDLTLEGESVINQLQVQRAGFATQMQTGTIRNIHVSTRITYRQLAGDPSVYFVDLVQYDVPSSEGDSGGVVVESDTQRIVGMHIAGFQDGSGSLMTHIRYVFDRMEVDLPNEIA